MKSLTKIIFVSLNILLVLNLYSGSKIHFDHISVENGLSHATVYDILQDSHGFIWFATEDGLNRYDGHKFIIYKNNVSDSSSISHSLIGVLCEDKNGFLWVGTMGGGLNKFDPRKQNFIHFKHVQNDIQSLSHDYVTALCPDDSGNLWVGTAAGLNKIDLNSGRCQRIRIDKTEYQPLSNSSIQSIIQDDEGIIWVGTYDGLFRFTQEGLPLDYFVSNGRFRGSLSNNRVWQVFQDASGEIWVGTLGGGLNKFNPATQTFEYLFRDKVSPDTVKHNSVYSIGEDEFNNLWIGTQVGLHKFNPRTGTYRTFRYNEDEPNGLTHDWIYRIYRDDSGLMWVSPIGTGLNKFRASPYSAHILNGDQGKGLSGEAVRGIIEDSQGEIWVGTGQGLNKVNPVSFSVTQFGAEEVPLSNQDIFCLANATDGGMWIGTSWGLNRFNPGTNKVSQYLHNSNEPTSLSHNIVICVIQEQDGDVWVGTYEGLNKLNPATGAFSRYVPQTGNIRSLSDLFVLSLAIDNNQRLWVGTQNGLNLYAPESDDFIRLKNEPGNQNSLSSNHISTVYVAPSGTIWIGTQNGLNRVDFAAGNISTHPDSIRFTRYLQASGLPEVAILGIVEDQKDNLWLNTESGIIKFNLENELSTSIDHLNRIRPQSLFSGALQSSMGKILFGGGNGLIIFDPIYVEPNLYKPRALFTDFQIFNQPIKLGLDSPLTQHISIANEIQLSYHHNVFSFEFSASDFAAPEKNRFSYRMEGFDEDWQYSGHRRFVTYTNMSPGDYTFKVKAANNDGIWSEQPASIRVIITPPWWRTWEAYLCYAVLVLVIVIIVDRVRTLQVQKKTREETQRELAQERAISQARTEERNRVQKKASVDFHDELGHLLTQITLSTEMAKRSSTRKDELMKYLNNVSKNASELADGMKDFIWVLDGNKNSLKDTLERIREFGDSLFEHSHITFRANSFPDNFEKYKLATEVRRQLLLIFKEAMNNSLKYAHANLSKFEVVLNGNQITISFEDNGQGFDPKTAHSGYGLKSMQARAEKLNGKLQIEPGGDGTKVIFTGSLDKLTSSE